jgi:geranylgeranyl diphosphate synthase, type II
LVDKHRINDLQNLVSMSLSGIYSDGPRSLTQPINYVLKGGGKRLRPILTILVAETFGTSKIDSLPAALAVEILHNFTLVHDDIMDEDDIRHNQPTVHKKWDTGVAILTGDAMLSLALKKLQRMNPNSLEAMAVFVDGLLAVCEGQALDKEFEMMSKVTLEQYIEMVDLKTGYLLGLSAELGALVADTDKVTRVALRDYARLLGRAFQVQDDLLEIFSDADKMGKSLESDIILGKNTYLMIIAKQEFPEEIKSAIELAKSNFVDGLHQIRKIMIDNNIKESAEIFINKTIAKANALLVNIDCDKTALNYFSNMIMKRNH